MTHRTLNIHERFLRHIWNKQYLTDRLQVADGRDLKVLDTGQLNRDGGPDFYSAKIKIGETTYTGDIEIHRTAVDWLQHKHQKDPRYNKVVLHVILRAPKNLFPTLTQSGRQIPVLILGNFLSDPMQIIWQRAIIDEQAINSQKIECFNRNDLLNTDEIKKWLDKLAIERLEIKLRRFDERLRQLANEKRMAINERQCPYGKPLSKSEYEDVPPSLYRLNQKDLSKKELWEQLLYEGIMEGLGYSKNREPFLKLAQIVTLKRLKELELSGNSDKAEALLFGTAGLIPKIGSLKHNESKVYVRRLTHEWKTLRPSVNSEILHLAEWQFFPTRPSNFPTVRIAAARSLIDKLLTTDYFRYIIQIIKSKSILKEKEHKLIALLTVEVNDFWKHHYSFDVTSAKNTAALGLLRIRDIIINAILPVVLLYARIFKDRSVKEAAVEMYRSLPASEENSIIRLIEKQLIKKRLVINKALQQQAVIQLYQYYCVEKRCSECALNL
jgi:hypothetical protein